MLNAHLPTQVSGPTSLPDTPCPQSCLSTMLHAGRCPAHPDTSPVLTPPSALLPMPGHLGPTPAFRRPPGHFRGLTPSLSAHRSNHGAPLLRIRGSAASSRCSSGPWTPTPLSGCPLPPRCPGGRPDPPAAQRSRPGPGVRCGLHRAAFPVHPTCPCPCPSPSTVPGAPDRPHFCLPD